MGETIFGNGLQEIGLVFAEVFCFVKRRSTLVRPQARVVARCDRVCPDLLCVANKQIEFDFTVAEDVWVGRSAVLIFSKKFLKNTIPIFGSEIGCE